ncbi:hypothetical protein SLS59_007199 [Nothophoma quercina]|uniref:Uncharacterized protein n=1 Tax=Nothophoma quercina TaxID=749835 RepID=A0ABR3R190_9PLEO
MARQHKADEMADTKSQDEHVHSQLASSRLSVVLPPRTMSWADETQDEIDAAEATRAVAQVEAESGITSDMEEAGGLQQSEETKAEVTSAATTTLAETEAVSDPGTDSEEVQDTMKPRHTSVDTELTDEDSQRVAVVAEQEKISTSPSVPVETKPFPRFQADAGGFQDTVTVEGTATSSSPIAPVEDTKPAAASMSWDDYINSMPTIVSKPLQQIPESTIPTDAPGASSYAAAVKAEATPKKMEKGMATVTPSLQTKATIASEAMPETSSKPKKRSGAAQRKKAAEAKAAVEAAAKSSPDANANADIDDTADTENVQPTASAAEESAKVDAAIFTPLSEVEDANAKDVDDLQTASPEPKTNCRPTPVKTVVDHVPLNVIKIAGVAETLAKFGFLKPATTVSTAASAEVPTAINNFIESLVKPTVKPVVEVAATGHNSPPAEDVKGHPVASKDVKVNTEIDEVTATTNTEATKPFQDAASEVVTGFDDVAEVSATAPEDEETLTAVESSHEPTTPRMAKIKKRTKAERRAAKKRVAVSIAVAAVDSVDESESNDADKSSSTTVVDDASSLDDNIVAGDKAEVPRLPKLTLAEKAVLTSKEKNLLRREERKVAKQSARGEATDISKEVVALINTTKAKAEKTAQKTPVANMEDGTKEAEQGEQENQNAAESSITSQQPKQKKTNKTSGAARRRRAKKQIGPTLVTATNLPATTEAPAVRRFATGPHGVQISRWNLPWFVVLAMFLAQLAIVGTGLYHLMLM